MKKKYILIFVSILLLASCKTPKLTSDHQRSAYTAQQLIQSDTIYCRDSVFIHLPCDSSLEKQYFNGQLAPIVMQAEKQIEYRDHIRIIRDTITTTDTIVTTTTIEIPKPIPRFYRLCTTLCILLIIALLAYITYRLYRRFLNPARGYDR